MVTILVTILVTLAKKKTKKESSKEIKDKEEKVAVVGEEEKNPKKSFFSCFILRPICFFCLPLLLMPIIFCIFAHE